MILDHKTLTYKGKVIFEKLVIGQFGRLPKTFAEKEGCFMFVMGGAIQLRTPNETIVFNEDETMLSKCGNYFFENVPSEKGREPIVSVGGYFYPDMVKELFKDELKPSDFSTDYDTTKLKIDGLLLNFRDSIDFLLENPSVADESLVITKLKEFLILLSKTESAPSVNDFIASLFKPFEYDFRTIIECNIISSLSLKELAYLCGMSVSSFKRKFSDVYGTSPGAYATEKKTKKACIMLEMDVQRISDVAFACGFESVTSFNRTFKKERGMSPSQYRLSLSANKLS